jgi:hypothetical protein
MAAYRRAAEEIEQAINEDGLTQRQVAEQIGKSQVHVTRLLKALISARITRSDFHVDWNSGSNKRSEIATTVPRRLPDQVRMATELLARPGVAEAVIESRTAAASAVQVAVRRRDDEQRQQMVELGQRERARSAGPLSGMLARITLRLQSWAGELVAIEPDLIEARDAFAAHGVAVALRDLAKQCDRIADRIDAGTVEQNVLDIR